MVRTLFASVALGLVAAAAGCSMCQHPYDYCYPLFTGGCDGQPCVGPRAGSIRAMAGPVVPGEQIIEPMPAAPYYDQSRARPIRQQPQMQRQIQARGQVQPQVTTPSRRMVSRSAMPWQRSTPATSQPAADARQLLPAADRESAKILSVTDETLAEVQARKARSQVADEQPTSAGTILR